jgi:site-specific DNA-methyltransferase (adenine-specific)
MSTAWNRSQLFSTTGVEGHPDWSTPRPLFEHLNQEFAFDLDGAAQAHNAMLENFISPEEDSLTVEWSDRGSTVWLNPPYKNMGAWMKKAYLESLKGLTVVALVLVRSDTRWWNDWAMKAAEVRIIRGRVYFEREGKTGPATAPSALLVFSEKHRSPRFITVETPRKNKP